MKHRLLLLISLLMVAMLVFAACSGGNANENDQADNDIIVEQTDGNTDQNNESEQQDEEPVDEEEQRSDEEGEQPVIVDGYDITAAVTGPSLKDAYEDYFLMGVALNGSGPENDTVQSAAMREIIKHQFNSIVYSNLMKPSYFLDQRASINHVRDGGWEPVLNFDSAIAGLEFAKEHDIKMRGHVLVWHTQVPEWFFKEGYQGTGQLVDRDTLLARTENYIKQVLEFFQTEYPGVIYSWDVVNEAVEVVSGHYETETGMNIRTKHGSDQDNLWYTIIGTDYIEKAFEFARKYADPEVKLFYNDYNTFQPMKTHAIYELASMLKEKDLIDGIGMQGHMHLDYPGIQYGNHNWKAAIEKFAELDLEIHVTELTINSEDNDESSMTKQADRYEELFDLFTSMDTAGGGPANITSVTVFGLMDEYMFYNNDKQYSRFFDGQLQPKQAFDRVISVIQ